jgi:predicted dehydrogenase
MKGEKLRLCLVGCGMIGRIHAQAAARHRQDIQLHLCDADAGRAEALAGEVQAVGVFESLEQVLSDPAIDAVDLCLPHHLHASATLSAFEAGKHVLLEKPLANSLAEADAMIEASRKAGLVFAVAENFRYEPAVRRAAEILARGDIGEPFLLLVQEMSFFVEVTTLMRTYDWRRRESTGGGGVLFDRGVHLMAVVNQLGGPVRTVYALTRRPAAAWEVDETAVVSFVHESGLITNLVQSWNARSAASSPLLAIYGTQGSIVEIPEKRRPGHAPFEIGGLSVYSLEKSEFQTPTDAALLEGAGHYMKEVLNASVPADALERTLARGRALDIGEEFYTYGVYEAAITDFLACIRTGKRPHVEPLDARADTELVFASYRSARTGRPVALPLAGS